MQASLQLSWAPAPANYPQNERIYTMWKKQTEFYFSFLHYIWNIRKKIMSKECHHQTVTYVILAPLHKNS